MNQETYERVQELFLRALSVDDSEREKLLATEDASIGEEVRSLLIHSIPEEDYLEKGIHHQVAGSDDETTAPAHTNGSAMPRTIGEYRLLQVIGEGGQGLVYMAQQQGTLQRKVAVKLIKPGMDSAQVLARFHAERQALAMMDHPSIAKVFDAGTADSGAPYFVMELVKGIPIDRFCEENQLSLRARLLLFLQVCNAVHHAHQKGMIHRDLKPSNLLVTMEEAEPLAKVIDFGIAKALDHRLTEKTLFTEYGQFMGTLEYMSPEQAELSAVDIDTRSDVYSLGVVLYQLLTGETPIGRERLLEHGMLEISRQIRETDPATPSSRITQRQTQVSRMDRSSSRRGLENLHRSDLDWIVMKALSKDRRRRYDSAIDFARDLNRYLKGEVVLAHPPSILYQVTTFVKRRRFAVLSGGVVAIGFLLGILGLVFGLQRAMVAEQEAKQNARELAQALYPDLLQSAWTAVAEQDASKARQVLANCPEELRGWEWNFVHGQIPTSTHQVLRPAKGSLVRRLDINADGSLAGCVLENGSIEVWDLRHSALIRKIDHLSSVIALELLDDPSAKKTHLGNPVLATADTFSAPQEMAVGTGQGELFVVDAEGNHRASESLGLGGIYDIAVSGNGSRIAVCTGAGWIVVFKRDSLVVEQRWKLPGRVASVAFLDSDRLAASGLDGQIYAVRVGDRQIDRGFVAKASLTAVAASASEAVFVASAGRVLQLNGTALEDPSEVVFAHPGVISSLSIDRDGKIVVGCGDGSLFASVQNKVQRIAKFGASITSLDQIGDSEQWLIALSDGRLVRADRLDRDDKTTKLPDTTTAGFVLPKLQSAIFMDGTGKLRMVDLKSRQIQTEKAIHEGAVWAASLGPQQQCFATVGDDQMLRVWELPSLQMRFEAEIDWGVRDVCFANDGSWIAAAPPRGQRFGGNEGVVGVWDSQTGECRCSLRGHENWVLKMAVSNASDRLITTCENRQTRIWDVSAAREVALIQPDDKSPAEHIAVGEEKLYLGHRDGWVTSWSLADGNAVGEWPAFGDAITGLAMTDDRRLLATSQSDSHMRITNQEMSRSLGDFDMGLGYVRRCQLSPQGLYLTIIGRDNFGKVFHPAEL